MQRLPDLLPQKIKTEERHHAMLAVEDIPDFMKDLRQHPSISARCLEFAILFLSGYTEMWIGMK